jgi:hypothetical protein
MEPQGALAYEAPLRRHECLPFPLRDYLELWLLDPVGLPLVLLISVLSETEMEQNPSLHWRAGHSLVEDYVVWQAPCLLMLPLQEATRRDLELLARQQPFDLKCSGITGSIRK